jgi:GAG-pre-integrase domain
MRLSGDRTTAPVEVTNDPNTNLPTVYAQAHGTPDTSPGLEAYSTPFPVASTLNANLTDAQRELVRWHQRLGHVGYRRVQFLLRSGVLSNTEQLRRLHSTATKLQAACGLI